MITEGLIQRQQNLGRTVQDGARNLGINAGVALWSNVFNRNSNEAGFRATAGHSITTFHDAARGRFDPLTYLQMGVEGRYSASRNELSSLDRVMNSLK